MEPVVPAYEKLGVVPQREGANLPSMAPNSLYPSRDGGWVLIAANSNPTWKRLIAIMRQPELLTDPRFETIQQRGKPDNMKAIDAIISAWSRQFDAAPLEEMLRQGEVPTSRVFTIADIYADPHFAARGMLEQVPHPTLGENALDILTNDLHLDAARIEHLITHGVVKLPTAPKESP
jgi:formyl-CoA transferase